MLYLILLRYRLALNEVDCHIDDHRAWLRQHYAAGDFMLSGPLVPRTGGAILARAADRETVVRWVQEDPFHRAGVAEHEIIAWSPTLRAPEVPVQLTPQAAAV